MSANQTRRGGAGLVSSRRRPGAPPSGVRLGLAMVLVAALLSGLTLLAGLWRAEQPPPPPAPSMTISSLTGAHSGEYEGITLTPMIERTGECR